MTPAPSLTQLLFVYGSLKRGQRAHHLLARLDWLGEAWLPGACLHDLGPFPMAVLGEGRIHGEIYRVGEADLEVLDLYEGAPRLFERHWLILEGGRGAWVYLGRPHQVRHVAALDSGCWLGPRGSKPRIRAIGMSQSRLMKQAADALPGKAFASALKSVTVLITPLTDAASIDEPSIEKPSIDKPSFAAMASIQGRGTHAATVRSAFQAALKALTHVITVSVVIVSGVRSVWAFDTLGACRSWQNSRGEARIELANSIGAAHYLTKMHRLQESDPAAPAALYSESDIGRICSER